jgi:hypothetical protein
MLQNTSTEVEALHQNESHSLSPSRWSYYQFLNDAYVIPKLTNTILNFYVKRKITIILGPVA